MANRRQRRCELVTLKLAELGAQFDGLCEVIQGETPGTAYHLLLAQRAYEYKQQMDYWAREWAVVMKGLGA